MAFLPITSEDVKNRGWDYVDFVFVTGDSYVDHPAFGTAIITRVLEAEGFRVAVLAQPNWKNDSEFLQFGKPRLGFMVNSGNIDSMVAHYTVNKRPRSDDAYTAGGRAGKRPDRALTVYSRILRRLFPDSPIIIGGLEASLRRFAHYDYWSDSVMPSVLLDSKADVLVYGMGENQTREIAHALDKGLGVEGLQDIKGICFSVNTKDYTPAPVVDLPSYERVCESKKDYAVAARKELEQNDAFSARRCIQRHGDKILICNPPMPPLNTEELDLVYSLPYERTYHPSYEELGGVPGIEEVEFSITHNRGCFGACNFCALAFHQGRTVTVRSHESVIKEAESFKNHKNFKGYISDVGGPTANFRMPSCQKQLEHGVCKNKRCLAPTPCKNLEVDHSDYLSLLRKLRAMPHVKKVFIRSGVRFDYLMEDRDKEFFKELVEHHVSGQLRTAPEHCSNIVLDKMGKPHIGVYKRFCDEFYRITNRVGKEQYVVPYLMSSHPGCSVKEAVELAIFLKKENIRPDQVQDFYPTPGTISTAMFYTGLDPYTMEEVYVAKTDKEKRIQRALMQYYRAENKNLVIEGLKIAGRTDLVGNTANCLIKGNLPVVNKTKGKISKNNSKNRNQRGKKPQKSRNKR